jgi:hypothetical protein
MSLLLEVKDKTLTLYDQKGTPLSERIRFLYQGSILSQLDTKDLGEQILSFRNFMRSMSSLDLLSPHKIRLNYKKAEDIGLGGRGFSPLSTLFLLRKKSASSR